MLITIDPDVPWQSELLSRPLVPGATTLEVSDDELAVLRVGQLVNQILRGGWGSLGRLWRPEVQRDVLLVIEHFGAENVTADIVREFVPEEPPPTKLMPYLRENSGDEEEDQFDLLPGSEEERIMAVVEEALPHGWCGWTVDERARFVLVLTRLLGQRRSTDLDEKAIRALLGAVDLLPVMGAFAQRAARN